MVIKRRLQLVKFLIINLIITLNFISTIGAQYSGRYKSSSLQFSQYVIELNINEQNKYIIELIREPNNGEDFVYKLLISTGRCSLIKDTLYLFDKKYRYTIKLAKVKNTLKTVFGPHIIKDCLLIDENRKINEPLFKMYSNINVNNSPNYKNKKLTTLNSVNILTRKDLVYYLKIITTMNLNMVIYYYQKVIGVKKMVF